LQIRLGQFDSGPRLQKFNATVVTQLHFFFVKPSAGGRGDSHDKALAETIKGLYKAEGIHRRAPWKTKEPPELATLVWVSENSLDASVKLISQS
jgi:hypothetical protein